MVFDEAFHFELVQFFSHRLNPIVLHQPASMYNVGAIAHSPSVLYYYVLGFPLRIFAHVTGNFAAQVIFLRVLNLLCVLGALVLLRKILLLMRLPRALAQAIVILFAFTPLLSELAAEVNYDNGVLLVSCACVYLALRFEQELRLRRLPFGLLTAVVAMSLLGSLVKYTVLPIAAAVLLFVAVRAYTCLRDEPGGFFATFKQSFFAVPMKLRMFCVVMLVVSGALFTYFYGYNIVKYHNPVPQCNQILTVQQCDNYAPWERNYDLAQQQQAHPTKAGYDIFGYTKFWFRTQIYQLYSSVATDVQPVTIPTAFYVSLAVFMFLGAVCCVAAGRKVMTRWPAFKMLLIVMVCYVVALWARNYHDYMRFHQTVGVQGRYLLPVLIYAYAFIGVCAYELYDSFAPKYVAVKWLRPAAATLALAAFVYFGGYVRYASLAPAGTAWQHTVTYAALRSKSS